MLLEIWNSRPELIWIPSVCIGLYLWLNSGWTSIGSLEENLQNLLSARIHVNRKFSKKKIKILSLNCWCHYLVATKPCFPRIQKLVEYIYSEGYDIVVFQELFAFRAGPLGYAYELSYMIEELQYQGFNHFSNPLETLPAQFGQNHGLLIASKIKFEFKEQIFQHLSDKTIRGYSSGKFSIGGKEFYLTTTHLSHAKWEIRSKQVSELCEFLEGLPAAPKIIIGDFNIAPEASLKPYRPVEKQGDLSPEYKYLAREMKGLQMKNELENNTLGFSKWEKDKDKLKWERLTLGLYKSPDLSIPPKEPQSVDHFFTSEEIRVQIVERRALLNPEDAISDHLAIHAEIDVKMI